MFLLKFDTSLVDYPENVLFKCLKLELRKMFRNHKKGYFYPSISLVLLFIENMVTFPKLSMNILFLTMFSTRWQDSLTSAFLTGYKSVGSKTEPDKSLQTC